MEVGRLLTRRPIAGALVAAALLAACAGDDGEASLEATFIDPEDFASFEASDEPDVEVVPVEDIGDQAFIVRRDGLPPATLYVLDGDRALSVSLANVLDGGNATEEGLTDLADQLLAASS